MKIVRRTRKQVYELWLKALRSGEYKQARETLRTDDGRFCCLGVLCDLARKDGGQEWSRNSDDEYTYDGRAGVLSDGVRVFMGLPRDEMNLLTDMNDSGSRFRGIATHIEKHIMPKVCK